MPQPPSEPRWAASNPALTPYQQQVRALEAVQASRRPEAVSFHPPNQSAVALTTQPAHPPGAKFGFESTVSASSVVHVTATELYQVQRRQEREITPIPRLEDKPNEPRDYDYSGQGTTRRESHYDENEEAGYYDEDDEDNDDASIMERPTNDQGDEYNGTEANEIRAEVEGNITNGDDLPLQSDTG
jgi:hypothetical protein